MTEAEWLASDDPLEMLFAFDRLAKLPSDRKLFLFAIACWTRVRSRLSKEDRRVLLTVEAYVEGRASRTAVEASRDESAPPYRGPQGWSAGSLRVLLPSPDEPQYVVEATVADTARLAAMNAKDQWAAFRAERDQQTALLRDIFGNPFRPLAFDPVWRTSTAVSLAKQMYGSRDFGAMPILADALQDAGCDSEDILNHCRDAQQVHVRGCWVVDCVLGKS